MVASFSYQQAREIGQVFSRHGVDYLFIGKCGAILLGFPDTTQDADLFVRKAPENCRALVEALLELQFQLTRQQQAEVLRGKDFVHGSESSIPYRISSQRLRIGLPVASSSGSIQPSM